MALGIEGIPAQRARQAAGPDDPIGSLDERPRLGRAEVNPEDVRPIDVIGGQQLFNGRGDRIVVIDFVVVFVLVHLGHGLSFDDHAPEVTIPAEGQRSRPERLGQWFVQRTDILERHGGLQFNDPALIELEQEAPESIGHRGHLDLLE